MPNAPRGDVTRLDSGMWTATCDHGDHIWYLERGTEYLACRSLAAHVRQEHADAH